MSSLLSLTGTCVMLGARQVVSDVTLCIAPGEIVALLGPNGAGKSTLLRAGLGLLPLSAGAARLGSDDPRALSPRQRALRAAYLPQHPQSTWPISVEHLAALGRYAYGAPPDRLAPADKAAVDAALNACALDPLRARRMDALSGGEAARAHLARTLAQHAPLLMLDEPTAGLDPAQALAVAEIMRAHAANGAVVFSTHDIALAARRAHRVVLLRAGRVLAQGAPEEALTPAALEAAYDRPGKLARIGDDFAVLFS